LLNRILPGSASCAFRLLLTLLLRFSHFSSKSRETHIYLNFHFYSNKKKSHLSRPLSRSLPKQQRPGRRPPPVLRAAEAALLPPPSSLSPALSLSSDVVVCQPAPATPDGGDALPGRWLPGLRRNTARGPRCWPSPRSVVTPRTPVSAGTASPALHPPTGKKP
jgi:hypothetical protein